VVDARMGGLRHRGLGVEGDAEAGFAQHGEIVRAVADGHRLMRGEFVRLAQFDERGELRLLAEDRLAHAAGEFARLHFENIGAVLMEADLLGDLLREQREAARDERRVGAVGAHGLDELAAAGRERDALGDHLVHHAFLKPFEQGDALAQRRLEGDLAAHGAFGDGGHMGLHADEIGELIDAFLPDHGGIHVGEDEAAATVCGALGHHVHPRLRQNLTDALSRSRQKAALKRAVLVEPGGGGKGDVHGLAGGEPALHPAFGQNGGGLARKVGGQVGARSGDEGCDEVLHVRPASGAPARGRRGMDMVQALLIAGPTASGKSALAIACAQALDGIVINADSMQVYADLRVLTARPSPEEEAGVPHLLFGHVDASVNYSVGKWLADAQDALAQARAQGRLAIFVGGTGMYFKALTQGLSDIPPVPEDVRARVRAQAQGRPPQDLHAQLAACDPLTAARLRPTDPQRILRALEIFAATGRPLAAFQGERQPPPLAPGQWRGLFLDAPRDWLYARIDARFVAMMEQGAVEEVRALMARGLDPALPAMRAHGVPGLIDWLAGRTSREAAVERGQADTRHYAKRQATFARHQLPDFRFTPPPDAAKAALALAAGADEG